MTDGSYCRDPGDEVNFVEVILDKDKLKAFELKQDRYLYFLMQVD
jgi:hypothetical protein